MVLHRPQGRGGRLEIEVSHAANDSIHHTEKNKTPITTLDTEAQLSFLVGDHINVLGGWVVPPIPQGEGIGAVHLGPSQNSPCASCLLLISILYNKTVIISLVLS